MTETQVDLQPEWRKILAARGVTLTVFASAMGTPIWTVYSYSRGTRRPTPEWLREAERVARAISPR